MSHWYIAFVTEIKKPENQRDDAKLQQYIQRMSDDAINCPNPQDKYGYAPLHYACHYYHHGMEDIVKLLIQQGANVNQRTTTAANDGGITPLIIACRDGKLPLIELLLSAQANINESNNCGWTPLFYAIQRKLANVVQLLLEKGADVSQDNTGGVTPLYLACFNGLQDEENGSYIASWLIDRGADVEQADNDGWTPLHIASREGNSEIVKLLIDRAANVQEVNKDGWTALHYACDKGQMDVIKLLVEKGEGGRAVVDIRNKKGQTPMALAKKKGRANVIRYLDDVKERERQTLEAERYVKILKQLDEAKDGERPDLAAAADNGCNDVLMYDDDDVRCNEGQTTKSSISPNVVTTIGTNAAGASGTTQNRDSIKNIRLLNDDLNWINDIIAGMKRFSKETNLKSTKVFNVMNQYHVELHALAKGKLVAWKNDQEIQAIQEHPMLWEFYFHLHLILRTSILDCEVRSSGNVESKQPSLLKYSRQVVRNGGFRKFFMNRRNAGQVVTEGGQFAIRSGLAVAGLPFGDLIGSIIGTMDERAAMIAATNVAKLATLANTIDGPNGVYLLVELIARIITRARCCYGDGVTTRFGHGRKFMVKILGLAEDTPIKQAAYESAQVVMQLLMNPQADLTLESILKCHDSENCCSILQLAVIASSMVLGIDERDVEELPVIDAGATSSFINPMIAKDGGQDDGDLNEATHSEVASLPTSKHSGPMNEMVPNRILKQQEASPELRFKTELQPETKVLITTSFPDVAPAYKVHRLQEKVTELEEKEKRRMLQGNVARQERQAGGSSPAGPLVYADPLSNPEAQKRLHGAEVGIAEAHNGIATVGTELAVAQDTIRTQQHQLSSLQHEVQELRNLLETQEKPRRGGRLVQRVFGKQLS